MNSTFKNTALLIIRIALGAFIGYAGYKKLIDMDGTIGFFSTLGLSAAIAWVIAVSEALIGLGLIFGVWTRLAAAALVIIMLGAGYYTSYEPAMVWAPLVASIFVTAFGGGKYALVTCKPKGSTVATVNTAAAPNTASTSPVTPVASVMPEQPVTPVVPPTENPQQ